MNRFLLLFLFVCAGTSMFAQTRTPQGISYQAVAVDNAGAELADQAVSIRASICETSATGTVVWQETHQVTTDEFGLMNLEIGRGTRTGGTQTLFSNVEWGTKPFFLKIEMDVTGGTNYRLVGSNELISVPYSLYAEKAFKAEVTDTALFAFLSEFSLYSDTANVANMAVTALNAIGDNDRDSTNELQTLTMVNGELILSQGGTSGTPISVDPSSTNEIQTLVLANGMLSLTGTTAPPVMIDPSSTNELQTLAFNNGNLSISNGNSLFIDTNDADSDPQNEIQGLTYNGYSIGITNGNSIDLTNSFFGAPGASSDFPQGIVGRYLVLKDDLYTVPQGNTLYITAGGPSMVLEGLGSTGSATHSNSPNMPILPSGTIIKNCYCTAFLVPSQPTIAPIIVNLNAPTPIYTVPQGKIFFLKSGMTNQNTAYLGVNGTEMEFLRPNFTRSTRILAFPAGTLLRKSATDIGDVFLTGYLIDAP